MAQFDNARSKPEPRRTQSATKLFVLRLSFVDLRALCGRCFGFPSWTFVPFVVDVLAFLRGPSCPLWWTFWQNEPLPPDLERDVRRPRPQAGAVKMPLPIHQFRAQFVEIEIGKRALAPTKIPQSAGQNRTRADKVASRVMMKSDRQLNQPLQMQPEPPTRSRVARQSAPHVLQSLMGVEKLAPIEEVKPQAEARVTQSHAAARSSPVIVLLPTTAL